MYCSMGVFAGCQTFTVLMDTPSALLAVCFSHSDAPQLWFMVSTVNDAETLMVLVLSTNTQ